MIRTRRRLLVAAVAGLAVLAVFAASSWRLYVHPGVDDASAADPADVILALGGAPQTAYQADRLFRSGAARHLVLSDPYVNGFSQIGPLCPVAPASPAPGVTCFQPHPSTTRGEAQELARLVRQNGWDDVIVMAPAFQISRGRYIVGRCYAGRLRMVAARLDIPAKVNLFETVYQSAAFVKAYLQKGC